MSSQFIESLAVKELTISGARILTTQAVTGKAAPTMTISGAMFMSLVNALSGANLINGGFLVA